MPDPAPFLALTDLRERDLTTSELTAALPRAELDVEAAAQTVRPLVEDVAVRGAAAVLDASERFDGVRPEHLRVPAEALQKALEDRKSTRLNSSHVAISYAVFCLKKK